MSKGPDMIECPECCGEGGFDDGPTCRDGCCFDSVRCDTCLGSGEVPDECIDCGDEIVLGRCVSCSDDEEGAAA